MSFLVLHLLGKESWLLYFNCIIDIMWLVVLRIFFQKVLWVGQQCVIVEFPCHTHFFKQVLPGLIDGAPDVISQALLSAPVWGKEQISDFVCNRLMQILTKVRDSIKQKSPVLFLQYTK